MAFGGIAGVLDSPHRIASPVGPLSILVPEMGIYRSVERT